jgi:hypothetical protein
MATFIKAGFWKQLCKPCNGYKGWLNLDEFVKSIAQLYPGPQGPQGVPGITGLFAQTEDSIPVTGTDLEESLINNGEGSLVVPPNGFFVGDSYQATLIGNISCVGSATLDLKIKTESGVLLADTQVVNMDTATDKSWRLDISFTIRQTGVAGVASIVSGGLFSYTKNAGLNFEGSNFSIINNTTFDTTVENKLVVTAQWNTDNAGNSIYSDIFILNKTY